MASHESSLAHDSGKQHPERPARIGAALEGVEASGLEVVHLSPAEATLKDLGRVHDEGYVAAIQRFCEQGGGSLDPDTHVGPGSWEAALRAAGAGLDLAAALESSEADIAFSLMRPPGHHALTARAMGFCVFNNIAVTARSLQDRGCRVAIIDWDVHHGNGTQDTFFPDPDVLYVSIHQAPFYPGTGSIDDVGSGAGAGATANLPFRAGTGGSAYLGAFAGLIEEEVLRFSPDWLLVSAGYDAHRRDPLAGMLLEAADYEAMARRMRRLVRSSRTIFFLEGGYDVQAIAASVTATLQGAAGASPPTGDGGPGGDAEGATAADEAAAAVVARLRAVLGRYR